MAPIVHTYRSGESGLFVNSYLVEGAEGVVAIDAPLLLSDGRAFRARLEALRKPLLGVLVTHPHPDHYNTIGELLAGEEVPVIAHADVDREIRAKDDAKRAQWGPMFGDEWPDGATFPNRTAADEETVELGDPAIYRLGLRTLRERERDRLAARRRRHSVRRRPGLQRHARLPRGRAHRGVAAST
jgi:glyoxylase-like metal-dependent hydrolase (beta-lactamase superfamily II)